MVFIWDFKCLQSPKFGHDILLPHVTLYEIPSVWALGSDFHLERKAGNYHYIESELSNQHDDRRYPFYISFIITDEILKEVTYLELDC